MKKILKKYLTFLLAAMILLSSSLNISASAASIAQSQGEANYQLLQEIIDLYLETSLYETDRQTLIDNMLYNYLQQNPYMLAALANSLLSANDPYSAYYTANSDFMSSTSKSYGIVVADSDSFDPDDPRKSTEGVYVTEILPQSNAAFAGILPGDRFVSLDGINVEGLTVTGIKYLLNFMPFTDKDPSLSKIYNTYKEQNVDPEKLKEYNTLNWDPAKEVAMVFERTNSDGTKSLVEISLPKGTAVNKDIYLSIDKDTLIATIQITAFDTPNVVDQFKDAFNEAKSAGCKKLIIDLRDNPGGYFDAAISLGSLFTNGEKVMFYINSRNAEEPLAVYSEGEYIGDSFEEYAVLINEDSASAAELFAYILNSQLGAVLIGEKSYGKALGQNVYNVINGDAFTITNFEILTADKNSYNSIGLQPDIAVPLVPRKYDFPSGLAYFNHENFVQIKNGEKNDPTLALEQRFEILGLMRKSAVDGYCDDSTEAAVMIYKRIVMNDKNPDGNVSSEMVTYMTATINSYKDKYIYIDSQLDVAKLYLQNNSRGKRLANEYVIEKNKYDAMIEAQEEAARQEYEEHLKQEQEQKQQQEQNSTSDAV